MQVFQRHLFLFLYIFQLCVGECQCVPCNLFFFVARCLIALIYLGDYNGILGEFLGWGFERPLSFFYL